MTDTIDVQVVARDMSLLRPRTAADILALPEGPEYGREECIIDGITYIRPTMPAIVCVFHEPDDILFVRDERGDAWSLGRYADGRWYRHRMHI